MRLTIVSLGLLACTSMSPSLADEVEVYEHNGSTIAWNIAGADITAIYVKPRPGLETAGVKPGDKLFEGFYQGHHIDGTAYAFKAGCLPVPYEVIGIEEDNKIVFDGLGPRRDPTSCKIVDYDAKSPHAHLVLIFKGRPR